MSTNWFVTGPPGIGKTTVLRQTAEQLQERGRTVVGLVAPEITEDGRRIGFDIASLDGEVAARMATENRESATQVGRYGVDVDAIGAVTTATLTTGRQRADVVVIDELGPMQLASDEFVKAVRRTLDATVPTIATIKESRLEEYLARFDIESTDDVIRVTTANRSRLPTTLADAVVSAPPLG